MTEEEKEYFHPEDQLFMEVGEHLPFRFTYQASAEDPGLRTSGLLVLVERSKFENAIGEMEAYLAKDI
jgi:hypothetical protein